MNEPGMYDEPTLVLLLQHALSKECERTLAELVKSEVIKHAGSWIEIVVLDAFFSCLMSPESGKIGPRRIFDFVHRHLPSKIERRPLAKAWKRFDAVFANPTNVHVLELFDLAMRIIAASPEEKSAAMRRVKEDDDEDLAHKLLGIMAAAQLQVGGCRTRGSVTVGAEGKQTCCRCDLLGQPAWFATLADLLDMSGSGDGVLQLPAFAETAVRQLMDQSSCLDRPYDLKRGTKKAAKLSKACRAHNIEFPVRELMRVLIRADLGDLLNIVAEDACPTMTDFWRLIPDGALDEACDAARVQDMIAACKREGRPESVAQIVRAAPVGSQEL
ncbi:hypothetical protein H9P43_004020 [Blastocladiella emersonii ATCC 22665]|nr:hypothetical protein H9P43_004020 [Blastocladiella emersonii ATCC 22665]